VTDLDREAPWRSLSERFDLALSRGVAGATSVTVLFSGGVDSTLVAHGVHGMVPTHLVTIGLEGSRDLRGASEAARLLGLPLRVVTLTLGDLAEAQGSVPLDWPALREPSRSVQLSLALALRAATDRRVLVGQGADELFGGYAHFRGLREAEGSVRRDRDWSQLQGTDWPRTRAISEALGKELRSPFLDEPFASFALGLTLPAVPEGGLTKPLLRDWAIYRGIPEAIAHRPKVALQYGSGVARALRLEHRVPSGPRTLPG
jgi:asparagine synthase (glutamine-hydrolysing)